MPLFRSKPKVIDAVQFKDAENPPRGVLWGHLNAHGEPSHYVVTAQKEHVNVKVGEWIVDEGDGIHFYPIADEIFKGPKGYDPV